MGSLPIFLMVKIKESFDLTLLLVEHNMGLVMDLCDRLVVLHLGRKLAEGTPEQIRLDPRVIAAYLGGCGMNVLEVHGLSAGYGSLRVLRGVEIAVATGTIVALLGANGAGKTTLLRALSGMLPGDGSIRLEGRDVGNLDASHRARLGIAHIRQDAGRASILP